MSTMSLSRVPGIKFGVDPAPVPLKGDGPQIDNLQDLIQRKREIQKNKLKFHLSEADCSLLLTNAKEYHYRDRQVIVQEGQELPSVYRIKVGKVNIVKGGTAVSVISQGWFLGETFFLNGRSCVFDASLVANGSVTIAELNLPFVKKLFEVDHTLALKFYRTLASKLSSVHYAILGHLLGSCLTNVGTEAPILDNPFHSAIASSTLPRSSIYLPRTNSSTSSSSFESDDISSSSSSHPPLSPRARDGSIFEPHVTSSLIFSPSDIASSSSSSSSSSSFIRDSNAPPITLSASSSASAASSSASASTAKVRTTTYTNIVSNAAALSKCPNLPDSFLLEVINTKKPKTITKRRSAGNLHVAFKTYKLESNGKGLHSVRLKQHKLNLMSEAFGFKHKNAIQYSKIKTLTKTTEKSVTIIYEPFLGKTLFFRTPEEAEEFYGVTSSLVDARKDASKRESRKSVGIPISSPTLFISDHRSNRLSASTDAHEIELFSGYEHEHAREREHKRENERNEPDPEPKQPELKPAPESKPNSELESKPAEPEPEPEPKSELKSEPAPEPEPKSEPKSESSTEPKSESSTEPKSESSTEPKPEPEAAPKSEPDSAPKEKREHKHRHKDERKREHKHKHESEQERERRHKHKREGKREGKSESQSQEKGEGKGEEKSEGKREGKSERQSQEKGEGKDEEKSERKRERKDKHERKHDRERKHDHERKRERKREDKSEKENKDKNEDKHEDKNEITNEDRNEIKNEDNNEGKKEQNENHNRDKNSDKHEDKIEPKHDKGESENKDNSEGKNEDKIKDTHEDKIEDKHEDNHVDKHEDKHQRKLGEHEHKHKHTHKHEHEHKDEHEREHKHEHTHEHKHEHNHQQEQEQENKQENKHKHEHTHEHKHEHEHEHEHTHERKHEHHQEQENKHKHDWHEHKHPHEGDEELKALFMGLAKRLEMKKGDFLMEEGDLYQRIYTILVGEVHAVRGRTIFGVLLEGEVIGLPSLLHLRPCPTTLVVVSETATILMLPAYKIIEMAKDNTPLAARLYKRTALSLQTQVERVMRRTRELALQAGGPATHHEPIAQHYPHHRARAMSVDSSSSLSSTSSPPTSPRGSPAPSSKAAKKAMKMKSSKSTLFA